MTRLAQSHQIRVLKSQVRSILNLLHVMHFARWRDHIFRLAVHAQWMISQVSLSLPLPSSVVSSCCCLGSLLYSWPASTANLIANDATTLTRCRSHAVLIPASTPPRYSYLAPAAETIPHSDPALPSSRMSSSRLDCPQGSRIGQRMRSAPLARCSTVASHTRRLPCSTHRIDYRLPRSSRTPRDIRIHIHQSTRQRHWLACRVD